MRHSGEESEVPTACHSHYVQVRRVFGVSAASQAKWHPIYGDGNGDDDDTSARLSQFFGMDHSKYWKVPGPKNQGNNKRLVVKCIICVLSHHSEHFAKNNLNLLSIWGWFLRKMFGTLTFKQIEWKTCK